eukprot:TRINITY_DN8973_c0_g1_i2.p1 TRINITY_DN8973_c0_g1~~TRINITY_DN8973_c0_g1_i2.p1  ORF type:complete len:162 (-),score=43.81 TRINITY_DN8973_c0_g1_i2:319-765(-)
MDEDALLMRFLEENQDDEVENEEEELLAELQLESGVFFETEESSTPAPYSSNDKRVAASELSFGKQRTILPDKEQRELLIGIQKGIKKKEDVSEKIKKLASPTKKVLVVLSLTHCQPSCHERPQPHDKRSQEHHRIWPHSPSLWWRGI